MKPLIFIPSPREIEAFKQATSKLPYDKLWVKNLPEISAYYQGRKYFLEHEDDGYTHLAILPDDLITEPWHFAALFQAIERYDCDVISGWCINTIRQMWNYIGPKETEQTLDSEVSFILPPYPPIHGKYFGYRFISVNEMLYLSDHSPIIKIKYSGFAPTIISRAIVDKIPFRSEICCIDSCFAIDLDKAGINQYCDTRVETTHLELRQKGPPELNVFKKQGEIIFESAGTN